MEILNIGPLELIVILVLMFILLGPKEMVLTANRIGKWVRSFVRSPMWREILGYSAEIRELPKKIMDESGLQETLADIQQGTKEAADELNNQLKEVAEAARVPEAEHLRIDPNAVQPGNSLLSPSTDTTPTSITPAAVGEPIPVEEAVPAVVTTNLEPASTLGPAVEGVVEETTVSGTPAAEPAVIEAAQPETFQAEAVEPPAVVEVAEPLVVQEEPVTVQKKPRRRKAQDDASQGTSAEASVGTQAQAGEEAPAPKRTRTRKSATAQEESAVPSMPVVSDQAQAVEETPAVLEVQPVMGETDLAKHHNGNGNGNGNGANVYEASVKVEGTALDAVPQSAPADPPPARRPRKPRAPKASSVSTEPGLTSSEAEAGRTQAEETPSIPEEQTQNSDAA